MKITVLQENLIKSLLQTNRIISPRSQLPILQNVLLKTQDNLLKVIATNMETTVMSLVGVKTFEQGEVCVSAKLFSELVQSLSPGTLDIMENEGTLKVSNDKIQANLATMPGKEFPALPMEFKSAPTELKTDVLKNALAAVLFAAATDEGRPLLTGIKIMPDKGGLVFASTDGYRLSVKTVNEPGLKISDMVVPAKALAELYKMISDGKEAATVVKMGQSEDGQLLFEFNDSKIATRLIEGTYPDFINRIPKSFNTKCIMDREALAKGVKSAAIFARDNANIVKMAISAESTVISANAPQVGGNMVTIDARTEGEDAEIAFNSRFLLDFLNNCESTEIEFEMTGSLNPGVFKPVGDESFIHIIMPVRTQS